MIRKVPIVASVRLFLVALFRCNSIILLIENTPPLPCRVSCRFSVSCVELPM